MDEQHPSVCEHQLRKPAFAALACLGLSLGLTWPLAARLGSALPAGGGDLWVNVWNFWWWDIALRAGQSPWWTPYLFHPGGAPLVIHLHSPLNMLAFAPFFDPATAYGLSVLVSTWLSAFGMQLLARDLTGSARAGLLAGLVFAFFPHRMEQTLEHLNLFSTQFLPLTLWAFFGVTRRGGAKWTVALGFFFAANALCDWHLALKVLLLLCVFALLTALRPVRPPLTLVRDGALAAALALLLMLPAAWPLLREVASGQHYQKITVEKGADLAFLLRPHFHHPLWGHRTREAYLERRTNPSAGFTSYLGSVSLALASVACVRRRRPSALWGGIFLGSLLLALGAHPRIEGRLIEGITLPFAWLQGVPLLGVLRVANRFLILAGLALAVLVAYGFTSFHRRSDVSFAFALAFVALDYLWLPYPLRTERVSPLYALLREGGPEGAVIDIPFTAGPPAAQDMRAQIHHRRPIAGGYPSVPIHSAINAILREPALADLYRLRPTLAHPIARERLRALGFGVVLLHKDRRAGARQVQEGRDSLLGAELSQFGEMSVSSLGAARRRLEEACGKPFYEDETVAAFDLGHRP